MREQWRAFRGVVRSLRIYYGNTARRAAMERLLGQFVQEGDLAFDVGAHVGDRVGALRRLGARVVALEPQPALVKTLKLLYGRDRAVIVEPVAVGRHEGVAEFHINIDNPTVSTASSQFVQAAQSAPGWERQSWSRSMQVPVTTLDALIARHGRPAFIKLDVEGYEAEALAGLTQAVPVLSFEFTTIQRDIAEACIGHCVALGCDRFNAAIGESHELVHREWQSARAIADWLRALPLKANSGDIYAQHGTLGAAETHI